MIKVYIASPYTLGDVAVNVKRQLDTVDILMNKGFAPFAPLYFHFQHIAHPRPEKDWLEVDLVWVEVCDVLLRLDGKSSGADGEVEHAKKFNIPVFYSIEDLCAYAEEDKKFQEKLVTDTKPELVETDFWKKAYEGLWEQADQKERVVKKLVEDLLDTKLSFYGLGAGKTDFIEGSAEENGYKKGDADLYIEKYDTFIEVTGPMVKVKQTDTLWVRPDKVTNSINKTKDGIGKHHFIIHVATLTNGETVYRAIESGKNLRKAYKEKTVRIINPFIRGIEETYIEIPHNHDSVKSMEEFKSILNLVD